MVKVYSSDYIDKAFIQKHNIKEIIVSIQNVKSTKLIEIVNANQKEVNRLKEELEQLKVHTDNATDSLTS